MTATTPALTGQRYDSFTLILHWVTAASVIFLFASAHIWELMERGTPLRKGLQAVHISCGILLALVMVVRPLWRLFSQRSRQFSMPPLEGSTLAKGLAHGMHGALYLLLFTQIVLGFLFRWSQHEPFQFFGLFDLTGWVEIPPTLRAYPCWVARHGGVGADLTGAGACAGRAFPSLPVTGRRAASHAARPCVSLTWSPP